MSSKNHLNMQKNFYKIAYKILVRSNLYIPMNLPFTLLSLKTKEVEREISHYYKVILGEEIINYWNMILIYSIVNRPLKFSFPTDTCAVTRSKSSQGFSYDSCFSVNAAPQRFRRNTKIPFYTSFGQAPGSSRSTTMDFTFLVTSFICIWNIRWCTFIANYWRYPFGKYVWTHFKNGRYSPCCTMMQE